MPSRLPIMFFYLFLFSLLVHVFAQNTSTTIITTSVPVTITSSTGGRRFTTTSFSPTTETSTVTFTPTSTASTTTAATSPAQTSPPPIQLDTVLDPAFGVLGAILILTGLPCAFLGHKNRWSSYFLTGFYTLSGSCLALIIKFGVLAAVNPPTKALRGLFVLSCAIAGIAGGAVCILFWGQAKYFVGALGGLAFGLWIQCFRDGGVIRQIGFRWILYIGCGVVGFVLCTVPKIHYHVLLASTAMVGATAFMLGVDCYTLVGLKEFYVYNLGFSQLFPKFASKPFPVTQTMQIELGLVGATALAGIAIQMRVLALLQIKLRQIKLEQKRRNEEVEIKAAERFAAVERDLELWENRHGRTSKPLLKSPSPGDGTSSPAGFSDETLIGKRARLQSGLSDFVAPAQGTQEDKRQSVGILPTLNLGADIEDVLPSEFVSSTKREEPVRYGSSADQEPVMKEKQSLLADIDEIRKSIDWLRSSSPAASVHGADSRRVSTTSRPRSLSQNLDVALNGTTASGSRLRVQSMQLLSNTNDNADSGRAIGRTTSTPLRDDEWDAYVQERQFFTPPSGPSAAIPTSTRPRSTSMLLTLPEAVQDAIAGRRRRESMLEMTTDAKELSSDDLTSPHHPTEPVNDSNPNMQKRDSTLITQAVQILPPQRRGLSADERPEPTRTRTFEELAERHKQKMRDLQNPLSQAEKEQAELAAAKSRWERSKHNERLAFEQRQAEKVAAAKTTERHSRRISDQRDGMSKHNPQRSLTPDQLATIPGAAAGRRSSTVKVLEWQRFQQAEVENEHQRSSTPPVSQSKRRYPDAIPERGGDSIPFPAGSARPPRDSSSRKIRGPSRK